MRVLLASSSSGSTGGGERYLRHLAVGLSRLGHRVQALCSTSPIMDKLAEDLNRFGDVRRVELVSTYQRPTRCVGAALDFEQQRLLSRTFRELHPEIVHINQQVPEDALDLVLAARNSGIPFLSTIHIVHSADELGARFGKLRDLVATEVLRRANAVHITVAERARSELVARLHFLRHHQVRVVLNGVVFPVPNENSKDNTRSRWRVAPGEVVLGSVGRLEEQKAPTFALSVIAALRKKGLPIRYIWIGDGALRTAFEGQAKDLGISDFVRLDGWRDDVSSCLLGLDVFLMPSRFEGMPLALLEAMAAGLCCCASDVDGITEAIDHGISGYLCPPQNLERWCGQIEALVGDPILRAAIGNRAREVARRQFGIESMARDTVKVYEDVAQLYGRRGRVQPPRNSRR